MKNINHKETSFTMKNKIFTFLFALISVSAYASRDIVPTDAVLAEYYEAGQVCVCIYVPDSIACNDIVFVGTYNTDSHNNWIVSPVADLAHFEAINSYDGWYVVAVDDETANPEGKPVMLDANGNFNWQYQVGAVTVIRGDVMVYEGLPGEIDLKNYGKTTPNVFAVDAWKTNLCDFIYHNYTITVISDGCDGLVVPYLVGTMTGWSFEQMQLDVAKTLELGVPTYSISFWTGEGTPYQLVSGLMDSQTGEIDANATPGWYDDAYIQKYNAENDSWVRFSGDDGDNQLTHETTDIVYDLRVDTLQWARCAEPISYEHILIDGVYYNFDVINLTAEVTSQIGGYPYWTTDITNANIPSSVTYNNVMYSVTSIGICAFCGCSSLTSIAIPNSITSIGNNAFDGCSGLTFIAIPNSVTSIGNNAFRGCSGLTSITIPNSVTRIENNAFAYCSGLASVSISNSITCIRENTFNACYGLTSITIPNSVTSIERWAFLNCSNLTSVTMLSTTPPSVVYNAFYGVASNFSIYVPCGSLDSYKSNWYDYYYNIKYPEIDYIVVGTINIEGAGTVSVPQTICDGNAIIAYANEGYHFKRWNDGVTDNPRTIELTQDTTFMAEFEPNTSGQCGDNLVWSLTDSVLTILGTGDMWDGQPWSALREQVAQVNLPQGITLIGSRAFESCSSLTSLIIPNTTLYIGNRAFTGCNNIVSFEGPAVALDAIPRGKLESIIINGGLVTNIYFKSTLKRLNLAATDNTTLPASMLNGFIDLQELVLPANLEVIDYMTVAGCLELEEITIPAFVTTIERRAFEDCRSLSSLTFAEGSQLVQIGNWAFYNCHSLVNIDLPAGVTVIGDGAFYGCTYLNNLSLPATVQSIGNNVFALCSKLAKMNVEAINPPEVEDKTFYEVSTEAPVYVPDESVEKYKAHPVWGRLNIVGKSENPQAVENIETGEHVQKILLDGTIYILRGDKVYTLQGQQVK